MGDVQGRLALQQTDGVPRQLSASEARGPTRPSHHARQRRVTDGSGARLFMRENPLLVSRYTRSIREIGAGGTERVHEVRGRRVALGEGLP